MAATKAGANPWRPLRPAQIHGGHQGRRKSMAATKAGAKIKSAGKPARLNTDTQARAKFQPPPRPDPGFMTSWPEGRGSWPSSATMPFDFLHFSINTLTAALNVLAAMITPALLISATGTYILSTTGRLGRVVDRMRLLADKIESIALAEAHNDLREEQIDTYRGQIKRLARRLLLLQRTVTVLYLAASTFILTSVAIGVVAAISLKLYWIPVALGLIGALFLLAASFMLIYEARLAVRDLIFETEFLRRLARHHAQGDQATVDTSSVPRGK
jgi:hypothetical protein